MCSAMAAVMGLQVAGGVVGAAGAEEEASSKAAYYRYLAAQNEVQAARTIEQGQQQAEKVQTEASLEQKKLDEQTRRLEGVQKTVLAARGVWSNSRTAQDIAKDTLLQSERDAATLRYQADYNSWAARTNAAESARALREQARGYRYGADSALRAGDYNALTSLLGAGSQVGSTYLQWSNTSRGATTPARYNPADTFSPTMLKSKYRPSSKLSLY